MKRLLILAISALILNTALGQYDPKALKTLEAMSEKYKAIAAFEANISYTMINEIENIHDEFKGKITVKGDKYRLVLPEQEVINNGTTLWTYLPDVKEVNIDDYDPSSEDVNPSKLYDMYKKGFKYLYLTDETEGGVICEVIDLVPEKSDAQFFKIRMNIAKNDKSLKSWTMFDKSGNKYKYTITKFNSSLKVQDSFFTFDPKKYPNVEVVDLR